jgi:hypothetical protein
MRWLKKVLTGSSKKEASDGVRKARDAACAGAGGGGDHGLGPPASEKRRWSFAKPRSSVSGSARRPSVAAGELSQVRPCSCGLEREVEAAAVIQKAFRGYLVSPSVVVLPYKKCILSFFLSVHDSLQVFCLFVCFTLSLTKPKSKWFCYV